MLIPIDIRLYQRVIKGPRYKNLGRCLLWTGSVGSHGYGQISKDGKPALVHRVAWELHHGRTVPPGLEVDHLCSRKLCCNHKHLEAITPIVNRQRQRHWNSLKTQCPQGHKFTKANTYVSPSGKGGRNCKICRKERRQRAA